MVASAAFFNAYSAMAQNAGNVSSHAIPIGKGNGVAGFGSAAPGTAGLPLTSNGSSADPSFQAIGNSGLSQMPANTIKCNPTGATAISQDCQSAVLNLGTSGAPISASSTTPFSSTIFSSYGAGAGANNPPNALTTVAHNYGTSAANTKNVRSIFAEAIDHGGNTAAGVTNINFVEAMRANATAAAGTSYSATYGLVAFSAGAAALPYAFTVGVESQADNFYANAPPTNSFVNTSFVASFLATTGEASGTFTADAGYMINPFNPNKYQTGFLVAGNTVSYAAFANMSTGAAFGIDLALGSYTVGAVRIPNNSPIRARNGANSADLNAFYVDPTNNVVLGSDAVSTRPMGGTPALTPSCTGIGSTGTCTLSTGSNNNIGKITVSPNGTGITSVVTLTVTFSAAIGPNGSVCTFTPQQGAANWSTPVSVVGAGATASAYAVNVQNNVAFTSGSTYLIGYTCFGY